MLDMTKRRLLRWSLILLILAAFAVWQEPTRVVWGWLRGEAFYQGRPTSWWAKELNQWDFSRSFALMNINGERICRESYHYARENSEFESFCERGFGLHTERPVPEALQGDPAAEAVLAALADHPSERVRKMAEHGLQRLRRAEAWRMSSAEREEEESR